MLYNTLTYSPQATSTNKLGITGYTEQFASQSDLTDFVTRFRSDAATANFSVVTVNGGVNNQSHPGGEVRPVLHVEGGCGCNILSQANLDVQYAGSISYPTPNIFYSTAGVPPFITDVQETTNLNEPYLDWLDFILIQKTIPQTISTSYGDDEQTVPRDYATSVCNMFAQLGVMGVSILFGSGDGGVGGVGLVNGSCLSNDGTNRTEFLPMFPASCVCYFVSITNTRDLLDGDCKVPLSRQLVAQLK
jgi:tripeptidyl-peptidase-1